MNPKNCGDIFLKKHWTLRCSMFSLRAIKPSYFGDLGARQFRARRIFTIHINGPFFLDHVANIIAFCSKEKMRWISAWWIVASMKNAEAVWNLAMFDFPRSSMRSGHLLSYPDGPIAPSVNATDPAPAFRAFLDLCKKSLFECFHEGPLYQICLGGVL